MQNAQTEKQVNGQMSKNKCWNCQADAQRGFQTKKKKKVFLLCTYMPEPVLKSEAEI